MSESKVLKYLLAAVVIAVLIPTIFFTMGFIEIRKNQNELSHKLEQTVSSKVETYLSDSGLVVSEAVTTSAESGTIVSKEYETSVADKITNLVMENITKEYKDELKNLVLLDLYDEIEDLVKAQYSEYTQTEIDAISDSVKTIVISELYTYINDLEQSVNETKNLYTAAHNTINSITQRTDSLESKISEITKSYEEQLQALAKKDDDLQTQIDALERLQSADVTSLKTSMQTINTSLTDAISALSTDADSSTVEIYYDLLAVKKSLEEAEDVLKNNIDTLDTESAEALATEIADRKAAIKAAIALMYDENNQLISDVNEINESLKLALLELNNTVNQNNSTLTTTINSNYSTLYNLLASSKTSINEKYDNAVNQLKKKIAENAQEIVTNANAIAANANAIDSLDEKTEEGLQDASSKISSLDKKTSDNLNNAVETLNSSIDTLNNMLEEVDGEKADIASAPKYIIEDNGNKVTIAIPSTYENLEVIN